MKCVLKPLDTFITISKCLKDYDKNLKNRKIMFIIENKDKTMSKEEVFFPKTSYYHLTGIILYDEHSKKVNSYKFYDLLKSERLNLKKYKIINRDNTTDLKLQVLPQLMKIDRIANIIGDFSSTNMFLQTEKIAGNVNACMGFVKDRKLDVYVPNTLLKKDIRDITDNRKRIIAILKKDFTENLYENITYLKQNYKIEDILKSKDINKFINVKNIYSKDKSIEKKIQNFCINSMKKL